MPYLVVEPIPADGMRLYRLARTAEPRTMLSHFHLGRRPRKREMASALVHMGLSMSRSPEALIDLNHKFDGRMGDTLLTLHVPPGEGIWFAATGPVWHVTVWSRPEPLLAAIIAEAPVEG